MTSKKDDLDAVRSIVKALEGFSSDDQERIIRWSREKIGLAKAGAGLAKPPSPAPPTEPPAGPGDKVIPSIREFITSKNPQSDNQLAATIAYYYRFEAPENQRKENISSHDLQDACRQAGRERFKTPAQALGDAHRAGLLDRADRGTYRINSVGENLVAMTLPTPGNERPKRKSKRGKGRTIPKKALKKTGRPRKA